MVVSDDERGSSNQRKAANGKASKRKAVKARQPKGLGKGRPHWQQNQMSAGVINREEKERIRYIKSGACNKPKKEVVKRLFGLLPLQTYEPGFLVPSPSFEEAWNEDAERAAKLEESKEVTRRMMEKKSVPRKGPVDMPPSDDSSVEWVSPSRIGDDFKPVNNNPKDNEIYCVHVSPSVVAAENLVKMAKAAQAALAAQAAPATVSSAEKTVPPPTKSAARLPGVFPLDEDVARNVPMEMMELDDMIGDKVPDSDKKPAARPSIYRPAAMDLPTDAMTPKGQAMASARMAAVCPPVHTPVDRPTLNFAMTLLTQPPIAMPGATPEVNRLLLPFFESIIKNDEELIEATAGPPRVNSPEELIRTGQNHWKDNQMHAQRNNEDTKKTYVAMEDPTVYPGFGEPVDMWKRARDLGVKLKVFKKVSLFGHLKYCPVKKVTIKVPFPGLYEFWNDNNVKCGHAEAIMKLMFHPQEEKMKFRRLCKISGWDMGHIGQCYKFWCTIVWGIGIRLWNNKIGMDIATDDNDINTHTVGNSAAKNELEQSAKEQVHLVSMAENREAEMEACEEGHEVSVTCTCGGCGCPSPSDFSCPSCQGTPPGHETPEVPNPEESPANDEPSLVEMVGEQQDFNQEAMTVAVPIVSQSPAREEIDKAK